MNNLKEVDGFNLEQFLEFLKGFDKFSPYDIDKDRDANIFEGGRAKMLNSLMELVSFRIDKLKRTQNKDSVNVGNNIQKS